MDFQAILAVVEAWIPKILVVVGAFATLATLTPNKSDDRVLQIILDIVNFLGANIGKAKNKEE